MGSVHYIQAYVLLSAGIRPAAVCCLVRHSFVTSVVSGAVGLEVGSSPLVQRIVPAALVQGIPGCRLFGLMCTLVLSHSVLVARKLIPTLLIHGQFLQAKKSPLPMCYGEVP